MNKTWQLSCPLKNAPAQAEELRIDRNGQFYWCDKGKVAWTKGVAGGNYSAISSDRIVATKTEEDWPL